MIAADTSSLSALLAGERGGDVDKLAECFAANAIVLPPAVLTEILSDPKSRGVLSPIIGEIGILEVTEGYWRRAGETRAKIKSHGLRANIGDTLIAQSCIDHDLALITRDEDFRHFAKHCGLKLA